MLYHVELLSQPAEPDGESLLRPVEVPVRRADWPHETLEAIFRRGQNEYQPRDYPSVSVGDVVLLGGDNRWLVRPLGFKRLTPADYENYKSMPRVKRVLYALAGAA